MEMNAKNIVEQRQQAGANNNDICPDLILNDMVMCDALERLYQPSSRQIRECCLNEYYIRCSLRRSA
jgi:hypothetical protein